MKPTHSSPKASADPTFPPLVPVTRGAIASGLQPASNRQGLNIPRELRTFNPDPEPELATRYINPLAPYFATPGIAHSRVIGSVTASSPPNSAPQLSTAPNTDTLSLKAPEGGTATDPNTGLRRSLRSRQPAHPSGLKPIVKGLSTEEAFTRYQALQKHISDSFAAAASDSGPTTAPKSGSKSTSKSASKPASKSTSKAGSKTGSKSTSESGSTATESGPLGSLPATAADSGLTPGSISTSTAAHSGPISGSKSDSAAASTTAAAGSDLTSGSKSDSAAASTTTAAGSDLTSGIAIGAVSDTVPGSPIKSSAPAPRKVVRFVIPPASSQVEQDSEKDASLTSTAGLASGPASDSVLGLQSGPLDQTDPEPPQVEKTVKTEFFVPEIILRKDDLDISCPLLKIPTLTTLKPPRLVNEGFTKDQFAPLDADFVRPQSYEPLPPLPKVKGGFKVWLKKPDSSSQALQEPATSQPPPQPSTVQAPPERSPSPSSESDFAPRRRSARIRATNKLVKKPAAKGNRRKVIAKKHVIPQNLGPISKPYDIYKTGPRYRVEKKNRQYIMSASEREAYNAFRGSLKLDRPERLAEHTKFYLKASNDGVNGDSVVENMPSEPISANATIQGPMSTWPNQSIMFRYQPTEQLVCLNCDVQMGRDVIEEHVRACVAEHESDGETRSSLSDPPASPAVPRRRSMPYGNPENLPTPYTEDASDSESVSSTNDANAAEILLAMKFPKITDVEKFAKSLSGIEGMPTPEIHARLENAQNALRMYQDEWMVLDGRSAKATPGDGIPIARNPRKPREYFQYQDRLEADVYGFEHDPHHLKVGNQNPVAQREGGRGANGRNLRHRMPTQKAAEADVSVSPESMATGDDNGRRSTRSRYGSSRPDSQSREQTPNPIPTFPSGKRKGRPPKNASRVEELRSSKSAHPLSRKNATNSPSALSKYETPDGSEDDTEPEDMQSSPRKQKRGRKAQKGVDVREAVRRAQLTNAIDSVESNDDDYGSIPADESRPTSSSSRVTRSSSARAMSANAESRKRKSAELDDMELAKPAKKQRGRRPKQPAVAEEDETDSNAVDTGADDTDATSGKTKKGGKPKSAHLSNVQKGKWAEDDGTRKAKQSSSMKLRWAKHAILKKYGHNQGNTLTGVHANMVMPTPQMQAEVDELMRAEAAKAESAQSEAAPSPSNVPQMPSAPQHAEGSSRPTPQQSADPEQNAAQPAAKPRPKKMVTLPDGTMVTAQSKVMRDRWEKKRAAIAAGLPVPQIGRYPAGSQANSASATPRAASQSASSLAASRRPSPDNNGTAIAPAAASEEAAAEPKKGGKGKRKRKEEPADEPSAAEVLESVEESGPPAKKSRGGRPRKASVADAGPLPNALSLTSQPPPSSGATVSEASAASSRTKRAPKPKVPFGEETPILPPGTTLPATSGKRKRTDETPILPPSSTAPKKKLGRPRKNTVSEDAPNEEVLSASKRRKTGSESGPARSDGAVMNSESQNDVASGSGTNPNVRKSSRARRPRTLGLDGADDSEDDEEQPRKMSEYEQFLALTSPALNSPLGPRGKRPAAVRASTSFVLPDTSSEVDEDEEDDVPEESVREEHGEGEGLQQELARQFKSEYDQFQAISSPGANIVLGKRNRKSVLGFGDVKREGSGSQGSQSPFRN